MRSRHIVVALTTTLALAVALPAGAVTARSAPREPACMGKGKDKAMAKALEKLADPNKVGGGLTALRMNGDMGCQAIFEWLRDGAAHGSEDQIEDMVQVVGRTDIPGALDLLLEYAHHDVEDIRDTAVTTLSERLPELSREEAQRLVSTPHADAREHIVGILAGHHSVIEVQLQSTAGGFGPTIPLPTEVDFYGTDSVPAAHAEAFAQLARDADADVREQVATVIGRMMWEGLGTLPSYPEHLRALIDDEERDVAEEAGVAAAKGGPPNGVEIVRAAIARADEEILDEMMDWFDEAVDEDRGNEHTVAMLRAWAEEGPEGDRKSAGKMADKLEKKIAKRT